MAKITYIDHGGKETVLDIDPGTSVMQGAVDNGVRGIIGDCGGACACSTCHVYVDPDWVDKLGDKSDMEDMMIEEVCEPQPNSRLSCQIAVTEELDGMIIRLPERQV